MATSSGRALEAIFIATPPTTPMSLTRTTTPRDLPTMYHFDFGTTEFTNIDHDEQRASLALSPSTSHQMPLQPPSQTTLDIEQPAIVSSDLTPCPSCSRKFNLSALRKHVTVCEKISKKRKVFDSSRQRREGTGLETYVLPKNFGMPNAEKAPGVHTPPPPPSVASSSTHSIQSPLPVRRKSSTELGTSAMRASMRKTVEQPTVGTQSNTGGGGGVGGSSNFTRERMRSSDRSLSKRIRDVACDRCPHCDRTFNPKAFDRHVEWCKEKAIQATIKLTNTSETNKAKERLDARKYYRPPNLKTKRSMNRDKYSGSQDDGGDGGIDGTITAKQSLMSLASLTSSVHSDKQQQQREKPIPRLDGGGDAQPINRMMMIENEGELVETTKPRLRRTNTGERLRLPALPSNSGEVQVAATTPSQSRQRAKSSDRMQLATLNCPEAPYLQPARPLGTKPRPLKMNGMERETSANLPMQATMSFQQLNGFQKRKDEPAICNIQLDESEKDMVIIEKSAKLLVRQVRQQERRRRSVGEQPAIKSDTQIVTLALEYKVDESTIGGCGENEGLPPKEEKIQRKLEAKSLFTKIFKPKKTTKPLQSICGSEPLRALPSPSRIPTPIGMHHEDTFINEHLEEEEDNCEVHHIAAEESENEEIQHPGSSRHNRSRSSSKRRQFISGLNSGDKYDPFVSAKRQLEELCATSALQDDDDNKQHHTQPTMTTSLIAAATTTTSTHKPLATSTPKPQSQPVSNFRRTSSLRGPRRTPLLPSRPLYTTSYRPTIQRGLSDEGPISTNFLKPEEFDEMPVRAACGNDFHSPRVIRRDTSASNRKAPKPQATDTTTLPLTSSIQQHHDGGGVGINDSQRGVSKTDSLAVFLKYEHELEQLNTKAADQLSIKELKEKTNNLSKQNSAKSIKLEALTSPTPPTTSPPQRENKENFSKPNQHQHHHNYGHIELPPLVLPQSQQQLSQPTPPTTTGSGIKLTSIFGPNRQLERKMSSDSSSDYIDPKLINACDNLPLQTKTNAEEQLLSGSSSQSTITPQMVVAAAAVVSNEKRNSAEGRNLLKRKMRFGRNQFLYDASPEEADCSSSCSADDEANRSSMEGEEHRWKKEQMAKQPPPPPPTHMQMQMPHMPTFDDFDFEEFLSSFENDDDDQFPLFKDCREFLMNRTTSRQRSLLKATSTTNNSNTSPGQQQQQPQSNLPNINRPNTANTTITTTIKSPPIRSTSNILTPPPSTAAHRSNSSGSSSAGGGGLTSHDHDKREIFISIETEPNAMGRSPISPASLRHMVGNSQTPIDMVEINDGHEPEHEKFSKISDNDIDDDDDGDDGDDVADAEVDDDVNSTRLLTTSTAEQSASPPPPPYQLQRQLSGLPNVQFNNAKNLMHQMQNEFRQLGEEAAASMRRAVQQRAEGRRDRSKPEATINQCGDSCDELSSLDGYSMSPSQSSRRGASSKLSSDSAYGSSNSPSNLSRQRSTELSPIRRAQVTNSTITTNRPHTANPGISGITTTPNKIKLSNMMMSDASTQAHTGYGSLKARQRLHLGHDNRRSGSSESSGSGSENSIPLPEIKSNYNHFQSQSIHNNNSASNNNNNNYNEPDVTTNITTSNVNNNNNNSNVNSNNNTILSTSLHSLVSNTSNGSMSASMKMSKFCHECGFKFIIDQAKFCMECGVRRMVL